ncbi:hypothetical protein EV702DRAFT_1048709 [Suillus placidus]|uniref:Uncharacterized protein n=1 Tax=Suillus placidus TaxID=48579 RepID=A0A9P6ZMC2_9AGAM|nr:hypothetical protein EV702DRAFT_1048709 [Suillus placidus]
MSIGQKMRDLAGLCEVYADIPQTPYQKYGGCLLVSLLAVVWKMPGGLSIPPSSIPPSASPAIPYLAIPPSTSPAIPTVSLICPIISVVQGLLEIEASGRDPESSYANSSTYEINDHSTPTPGLQESSHDKYTPTRVSTQESASIIFTTPTHRSASAGLSSKTHKALHKLYDRKYGACHCLVTSSVAYLATVAHAVQCASKSDLVVSPHLHGIFDAGHWFLLPGTGTLRKVHGYVKDAVASRANSQSSKGTKHFWLEWNLNNKTPYTFIPLPGAGCPHISCEIGGGVWEDHSYPYQGLPLLECHIAPPFAIINAGPKCKRDHINQIVHKYCLQQMRCKERCKGLGGRKDGLCGAALTDDAVLHLEKQQKKIDLRTRVWHWVTESTRASSLDPEPYA